MSMNRQKQGYELKTLHSDSISQNITKYIVFFSVIILLLPVLLVTFPPVTDYPNHLSRLWLIGGGANALPISQMYRITWDAVTNIGIDLVAVMLGQVFDYETTGRIIVAAAVILLPLGGVLLWKTLYGRFHWWQLSFGLLAWNMSMLVGFLNFEMGLGVALLAGAIDPWLRRRGVVTAFAARAVLGGVLMIIHASGLIFYAVLLCGMIIGPNFRIVLTGPALFRIAKSMSITIVALAVPALLLILFAPSLPGKETGANLHTALADFQSNFWQIRYLPMAKFADALTLRTYVNWVDAVTLAALIVPALASLVLRRLEIHAGMLVAAVGLMILYVVFPRGLMGAFWIDARFSSMAYLTFALAVCPDLPLGFARTGAGSLLVTSILRTAMVAFVWYQRQADFEALARALSAVPPGSSILPLEHQTLKHDGAPLGRYVLEAGQSTFRHMATLAVPWRSSFVPTLFTARGMQPVRVLPPWSDLEFPNGGVLASVHVLVDPTAFNTTVETIPYLRFWQQRFDFALVVNADVPDQSGPFVAPPEMELVKDEGFAQLYRIQHPPK